MAILFVYHSLLKDEDEKKDTVVCVIILLNYDASLSLCNLAVIARGRKITIITSK